MPIVVLPLEIVMLALVALLLLLAGYLLGEFIQRTVTGAIRIPGVGGIDTIVRAGVEAALRAMTGALTQYARNLAGWITAAPHVLRLLAEAIERAIWAHATVLRGLLRSIIPRLQQAIVATAQLTLSYAVAHANRLYDRTIGYANSIRNWAGNLIARTAADILARLTAVQAALHGLIIATRAQLAAYALALFDASARSLSAAYAQLGSYIIGQVARLEAYARDLALWASESAVAAATDWARRYVDAAIARLSAAIAAATALAMAPAWPRIGDAIDAIAAALPEGLAAILRRAGAIPRLRPLDLASAIGALAAVSAVSLDWIRTCGLKLCRDLTGIADEIASLDEELIIADIVGLVAIASQAPGETAKDVIVEWGDSIRHLGSEFADIVNAA